MSAPDTAALAGPPASRAGEAPPPAAEAAFRTSWRAVFSGWGWGLLVVPLVVVLAWASGVPLDVETASVLGLAALLVAVGMPAWDAVRYRLLGVAEVRVAPGAVEVVGHGGAVHRVPRRKLEGARLHKRWVLRAHGDRVVVREVGFTTDDWVALSAALTAWKVEDAHGPLPGVERRQREGAVFKPRRPWARALALGIGAVFLLGVAALSVPDYRDGSWVEDFGITVLFPLLGGGLAALLAVHLPQVARRVTFGEGAVRFDRLVGGSRMVPYEDVIDAHGEWVDTRAGAFYVGRHDSDVFARLLDERLAEGQLAGRRWAETVLMLQPRVLIAWLGGLLLVAAASIRLAPPESAESVMVVALVVYALVLWAIVKVWARRLLRDAD